MHRPLNPRPSVKSEAFVPTDKIQKLLLLDFLFLVLQNVTAHFGLASPNSPASKRDPSTRHARFHIVYSYRSVFFFVFAQNSTSNWTSLFVFLLNEAKLPCCSVCMDSWLIILYDFCTFALLWQVTGLYFWWLLFSCFVLFFLFWCWKGKITVCQENRRSHYTASRAWCFYFVFFKCCQDVL